MKAELPKPLVNEIGLQNLTLRPGTDPGVKNAVFADAEPVLPGCALDIDALLAPVNKQARKHFETPQTPSKSARGLRQPSARMAPVGRDTESAVLALLKAGLF